MDPNRIKELNERKGEILQEIRSLISGAKSEKRSMTSEENEKFEQLGAELDNLKRTIENEERAASLLGDEDTKTEEPKLEKRSAREIVADMVRHPGKEVRANENTIARTGNIVPAEFSRDIIKNVTELCGIMNEITVVNSKGTYKQIIAGENKITAGWTDEIADIIASTADFTTIEIGHHKLTSLVKISLELINQNEFDVVSEFTSQMNLDFALKAEQGIISGDGVGKPYGLITSGTEYNLAAPGISSDDLVKIFHTLKAPYHNNAKWIMNNNTLCAIRLIKDGNGQYMFHQSEMTNGYVGTILGKPVRLTECMDGLEEGKSPVLFGDYKRAYKANLNPDMSLQVLMEMFAGIGARGILGILWVDGRPVNKEAYVKVKIDE